ncbi:hypothetical protein SDC9_148534 [bioreactor metagenome]|uniref:Uncharacterized protein n=1 Tax=bioreactor metagenome TaxID=1076179 RepID=A0A645EH31_9ZZZZ
MVDQFVHRQRGKDVFQAACCINNFRAQKELVAQKILKRFVERAARKLADRQFRHGGERAVFFLRNDRFLIGKQQQAEADGAAEDHPPKCQQKRNLTSHTTPPS